MTETVKKTNEQISSENRQAAIRLSYGRATAKKAKAAKRQSIIDEAVAAKIAAGKKAARARRINEHYSAKKAA